MAAPLDEHTDDAATPCHGRSVNRAIQGRKSPKPEGPSSNGNLLWPLISHWPLISVEFSSIRMHSALGYQSPVQAERNYLPVRFVS